MPLQRLPSIQKEGNTFSMNRFYIKYKKEKIVNTTKSFETSINRAILNGYRVKNRRFNYRRLIQKEITQPYWKKWKTCVLDKFCNRGSTENKKPLGKWITEGTHTPRLGYVFKPKQ